MLAASDIWNSDVPTDQLALEWALSPMDTRGPALRTVLTPHVAQ